VEVSGHFTAGTSPQFMVFGITVDASAATLRGAGGATLTLADFFTPGGRKKCRGERSAVGHDRVRE